MACLNSPSIFTAIEQHFTTLTAHHRNPLTLPRPDGPDTMAGDLTLPEARALMRDVTAPLKQRDQIWRELITRSRATPDPWQLTAIWMMLPGLKSAAYRISRTTRLDVADLRSAVITGFLEALAAIDPERDNLGSALYWSAYNAGRAACQAHHQVPSDSTDEIDRIAAHITDTPSPVHRGIVETTRAGHPGCTRVEGERLGSIAHRTGLADGLHRPSRCRRHIARLDHRNGPHGRRVVLRVFAAPIRNLANVPVQPIDQSTEH